MKIDTAMMSIMRNVIMMKVPDSIQSLIFRNLKEEFMLMTSWIGLIRSNVSLSIVIPRTAKGEVDGYHDAQECFFWWKNLKRQRQRDGKKKIETWENMKK